MEVFYFNKINYVVFWRGSEVVAVSCWLGTIRDFKVEDGRDWFLLTMLDRERDPAAGLLPANYWGWPRKWFAVDECRPADMDELVLFYSHLAPDADVEEVERTKEAIFRSWSPEERATRRVPLADLLT